ncbi:GNAT family N-acetyltransferase [Paenibacillus radicis (ex Gao et al. 2016)]|uniref:N-acetyltransferase domain-containing protein n=1 Tax=Paenibacillus radicis (ex Gao et al. 2016) TaxID=1737354 RepID=A0A917HKF3_9BACL|nr:GNAT family N-acetyltransferase [Paenibacillus radicis (ex Gao et al. 2016)]GGG81534.1 hypothetical protein GCM10010918_43510 [Paenibacillus radicis (ex Gao et al. 2016)]
MKIVELQKEYLGEASLLVNSVFGDEEEGVFPARELEASLDSKELSKYQATVDQDVRSFQYYIAIQDHHVMGIIGLYELQNDFEKKDWIGWYCVDERYRGQRIGINLLDYAVEKARLRGKEYLCLYTSTHENEKKAQMLYDQNHFHITKIIPKIGYDLMYRQKRCDR